MIPAFIIEQFEKKQFKGEFQAVTMFVDITGFTAITQILMNNGKEGAEILADAINQIFTPAIDVVLAYGGYVSSFAGDAFTAIFPSDSVEATQALSAAVHLQSLFLNLSKQETKFCSFDFSVKIGLSHGLVSWGIISQHLQNSYYFGGKAIIQSSNSEQNAASGEIIIDDKILIQIENHQEVIYKHKTDSYYSLASAPAKKNHDSKTNVSEKFYSIQNTFIPKKVLSIKGCGEFRDIVSCFVSFDETCDFTVGIAKIITLTHQFGGYFNKISFSDKGGIMLILFGAPINPGNLYSRALNFALAISKIPELTLHIGLTYGTVFSGFIGRELCCEYTAIGSVVNLSARFTQEKKQGAIYLDEAIYRQVHSDFVIQKLDSRIFKGFADKIPLFNLIGKKESASSSYSNGGMVARDAELNLLIDSLQPLTTGKMGGVFYIYGNPGIGKSRLVHELIELQEIRTIIMQTDSILKKPLNPFTYFFFNYFKQNQEISRKEKNALFKKEYQKLIKQVNELPEKTITSSEQLKIIMELSRVESIIGALVGVFWEGSIYDIITPQDRAIVTEQAIKEFFKALCLVEPIILFIEDIQWLDNASHQLFTALTRGFQTYPLIIIATSRFNDDGSKPKLKVDDDVPCKSIILEELSSVTTKELIEDRVGGKVDDKLAAYIRTRTQGNPFYIEQFCLYLQENQIIKFFGNRYHLVGQPNNIPSDINMILVARIDRLPTELKETVQIASVLGREFKVPILKILIELIQAADDNEVQIEFICSDVTPEIKKVENERIWSAVTKLRYIFSHALMRDAVYDMQLRARLRGLHKLAGDAIVKQNPDKKTTFADCAFHYEHAEDWENALTYYLRSAEYYRNSIQFDEALIYCGKGLSICLETQGKKHQKTATCYNIMGSIHSAKGEYDTALDWTKKALELRKELLGKNHQKTAQSYNAMGTVFREKGDYKTSLLHTEKAIKIQINLFGENHIDIANSYDNMGITHNKLGNFDQALSYNDKAIKLKEAILGTGHSEIAIQYNNIGAIHREKGNFDTALFFQKKALVMQLDFWGEKHPDTAKSYNNIGSAYWEKGDYKTALKYLEKSLAIRIELLGERHPDTARSINNIGVIQERYNNHDESFKCYEKALIIRREVLGEKHPDTAWSYNNLGSAYRATGDYDKALNCHEKALAIQNTILRKNHPHLFVTYTFFGKVYKQKGEYKKALENFNKALIIRRELSGDTHPYTALVLMHMATVNTLQGNYQESESLLKQSLNILKESVGEQHSYTITCIKNFIDLYEKSGNNKKVAKMKQEMIRINEEKPLNSAKQS